MDMVTLPLVILEGFLVSKLMSFPLTCTSARALTPSLQTGGSPIVRPLPHFYTLSEYALFTLRDGAPLTSLGVYILGHHQIKLTIFGRLTD